MKYLMTCYLKDAEGEEYELTEEFEIPNGDDPVDYFSGYIQDHKHPNDKILCTNYEEI